jgi:3-phosphoshikimate 1-carboxyvinyltransferase
MEITVHASRLSGTVMAPPSKSLTQRAVVAGLLSHGTSMIHNLSFCNDSLAAMKMAESLGAVIRRYNDRISITAGKTSSGNVTLHCGESGLALRMFAPVALLFSSHVTMTGEGSLIRRPVNMITEALPHLGVECVSDGGLLPITLDGRIRAGRLFIDGSAGSQFLTGLLMTLPVLGSDSEITVANLKSKPYISLTLKVLEDFGISIVNEGFRHFRIAGNQSYRARAFTVEGDWSAAAFLLVAGAIGGDVTVGNLDPGSLQADRSIVQALNDAGCHVRSSEEGLKTVQSDLKAFIFDATDSPDLFPPLAALAANCRGTSRISGVSRLSYKESDRAGAIREILSAMKIRSWIDGDDMYIEGGRACSAVVSSRNDHRIAMMAAVMAIASGGKVTIRGAEAVAKSFPEFYDSLAQLGALAG